jgi:hypothetical protein
MNCPKCNQLIENGAAFCGNCGQPLQVAVPAPAPTPIAQVTPPVNPMAPASPIAQVMNNQAQVAAAAPPPPNYGMPMANTGNSAVPAYAIARNGQHAGETKALLSVIFGVIGLVGAIIMPLIPIVFGITGLVLGTMTRRSSRPGMSMVGIVLSSLAILGGIAGMAYNITHNPALHDKVSHSATPSSNVSAASSVDTPCYGLGFTDSLQISNDNNSCDMQAFNGKTINSSTDLYKVYANQIASVSEANFESVSKEAIEKDIKNTLTGFTTDSEKLTTFAGSSAYLVRASDPASGVSVLEGSVLHKTKSGYNYFILVHATSTGKADFDQLEAQWQWK